MIRVPNVLRCQIKYSLLGSNSRGLRGRLAKVFDELPSVVANSEFARVDASNGLQPASKMKE